MGAFPSIAQIAQSGQRLPLKDLAAAFQRGTATLSGGTITVTGVTVTSGSQIYIARNTPGGTLGNLSAPSASRTVGPPASGQFVINSDSGTETSTVDWVIVG